MKKVHFIFRKKNPLFFSIEKVFEPIISHIEKSGWEVEKIEVPNHSSGISFILKNIFSLRKLGKGLFHITGDIHYAVFAFSRKRTILTIHDLIFLYQVRGIKRWVLLQLYLKWPVWFASQVTTISDATKNDILKFSSCDPNKIKVIPNPVNEKITYTSKKINTDLPIFLFIGSTSNKNIERVIEALIGIKCRLEIIGEVENRIKEKLEKAAINYNISSNLDENALNKKYTEVDILLFPSLFEGFGLPILEAQKAGRLVITSNISPMKDVAGKGACLVNPLDPVSIRNGILKLLKEPELRDQLLQEGFHNIKQYEVSAIAAQYMNVYSSLLN